MKASGSFLLLFCFFCSCYLCNGQATVLPDSGLALCIRYHPDGNRTIREYDSCTSFCCGGEIVSNATNQECCGSIEFGRPYNPRYQSCCQWWTGHGMGHVRRYTRENINCCGTHRINWRQQSCCYGHPDPPEVFNHLTEICCNAHRIRLPNVPVWATKCCGDRNGYDQRFSSCPCDDGQVLNVPKSRSECCRTEEGLRTPYIPATQFCCGGFIGNIEVNFCCGGNTIGTFGDQVCCSGKLFPVEPRNINKTECCNGVAYDPRVNLCCDDQVMAIVEGANLCCVGTPYNPTKSVCCMTNLWSTETQGTDCCADTAFFPGKGSFCCNGIVFLTSDEGGDACCGADTNRRFYFKEENQFICCNGTLSFKPTPNSQCCGMNPYNPDVGTCCDNQIFDADLGDSCCSGNAYFINKNTICCNNGPFGPFKNPQCCGGSGFDIEGGAVCCGNRVYGRYRWPACCVDVGYDASTHVCCGARVTPIPNDSSEGACCGSNAYDRRAQLCCSGENITIPENIRRSRAQCCGFVVYDTDSQLCCAGEVKAKTDRFNTRCCGITSYNTTEKICCESETGGAPVLYDFEFGVGNTGCCGEMLYNMTSMFCCEGFLEERRFERSECCSGLIYNRETNICCQNVLRPIGIVPWRRASCCGSECFYRGPQKCCNDRIYQANVRTNATCGSFTL